MVERKFLDGIDLEWGNVDATLAIKIQPQLPRLARP